MGRRQNSISPEALYRRLGSEAAPTVVDVRRDADFAVIDTLVAEAFHSSDLAENRKLSPARAVEWHALAKSQQWGSQPNQGELNDA